MPRLKKDPLQEVEGSPYKRLRQASLAEFRKEVLAEQKGLCALCRLPCETSEAVVDHCHSSGFIRGVLHRSCNALLGKIENNYKRVGIPDLAKFLAGVQLYRQECRYSIYHPTYRTKKEKAKRAYARTKKRKSQCQK